MLTVSTFKVLLSAQIFFFSSSLYDYLYTWTQIILVMYVRLAETEIETKEANYVYGHMKVEIL